MHLKAMKFLQIVRKGQPRLKEVRENWNTALLLSAVYRIIYGVELGAILLAPVIIKQVYMTRLCYQLRHDVRIPEIKIPPSLF